MVQFHEIHSLSQLQVFEMRNCSCLPDATSFAVNPCKNGLFASNGGPGRLYSGSEFVGKPFMIATRFLTALLVLLIATAAMAQDRPLE